MLERWLLAKETDLSESQLTRLFRKCFYKEKLLKKMSNESKPKNKKLRKNMSPPKKLTKMSPLKRLTLPRLNLQL